MKLYVRYYFCHQNKQCRMKSHGRTLSFGLTRRRQSHPSLLVLLLVSKYSSTYWLQLYCFWFCWFQHTLYGTVQLIPSRLNFPTYSDQLLQREEYPPTPLWHSLKHSNSRAISLWCLRDRTKVVRNPHVQSVKSCSSDPPMKRYRSCHVSIPFT